MSTTKISHTQKILILEWLEKGDNRRVLSGPSHLMSQEEIKRKWQHLSVLLNNCGSGPHKTADKWRRTFIEFRCHLKRKHRTLMAGKKHCAPLTDIEGRFLNVFGRATLESVIPEMDRDGVDDDNDISPNNIPFQEGLEDGMENSKSQISRQLSGSLSSRLIEQLEMASRLQADALNNIAAAMNRIADSNEALHHSMGGTPVVKQKPKSGLLEILDEAFYNTSSPANDPLAECEMDPINIEYDPEGNQNDLDGNQNDKVVKISHDKESIKTDQDNDTTLNENVIRIHNDGYPVYHKSDDIVKDPMNIKSEDIDPYHDNGDTKMNYFIHHHPKELEIERTEQINN